MKRSIKIVLKRGNNRVKELKKTTKELEKELRGLE